MKKQETNQRSPFMEEGLTAGNIYIYIRNISPHGKSKVAKQKDFL